MPKKLQIMNLKKNEDSSAELLIYGDIGESFLDEVSSKRIVKELTELDVEIINLRVNSNGGGTMAAIAIGNALKKHKAKTIATIEGIAASAATIITSCCDEVKMHKNALFMIHNPWTVSVGDEKDMEKSTEILKKVKNSIIETYIDKTGLSSEELSNMMDAETWLSGTEALHYGFINEVLDAKKNEEQEDNEMKVENTEIESKVETETNETVENKIEKIESSKELLSEIKDVLKKELLEELRDEISNDYRNENKPVSNLGLDEKKESFIGKFLGIPIESFIKKN